MIYTNEILFIFIAVLLVCLIGFKKYVWFISLGYGFSISAIGIMLFVLFNDQIDIYKIIGALVLVLYGFRLGGFLAFRELRSSFYNQKMKGEISDGSHMSFLFKIMLWLSCSLLYLLMASPIIFRFVNNDNGDLCFIIGIVISAFGIIFEALSDSPKNRSKKKNPDRFCDSGLYKIVRCPNYLGELIIWTGILISGFTTLHGIGQWTVSIIGYIGIVYIMFSGARRLELRQDRTYGNNIEYKNYIKTTPILIPLIPLYSVKKYKWLVG